MPRQRQKRGRRRTEVDEEPQLKRRKSSEHIDNEGIGDDIIQHPFLQPNDQSLDDAYPPVEKHFFGILDEEEQEHFKLADATLAENAFADRKERDLLLSKVYCEADGKELKIAQSQSCSRLMERLICSSTASQLKRLFQKFSGNFIRLVTHRFASHCCEALFLHAASHVTQELLKSGSETAADQANVDGDEVYVSMENLYLHTLAELEGNIGFLVTDRYASHVLRILLLILAGEPLEISSTKSLLQSRKKESIEVHGVDASQLSSLEKSRSVPKAFDEALEKLIAESMAGFDTDRLRSLATHPNGNPTLQLLLKLELTKFGKQRARDESSVIRTLLPDDPITSGSSSADFISGLLYDPVGSHLVEKIIEHAPGKMFKSLYRDFFQERLASLARNEVAGYIACRLLQRMSRDDLFDAHERLIPAIRHLLERNRTMVIRTLIEQCSIRDIDMQAIAVEMDAANCGPKGFDVIRFLKLDDRADTNGDTPHDSVRSSAEEAAGAAPSFLRPLEPVKIHFNLLAQAMLLIPGSLSSLILAALVELDPATLLRMANDHVVSRTLQRALITKNASIIERRKLIQHFYGHVGEMALDKAASHVVDCIWEGTHGLAFIRERIAEELAENEAALRDSQYGRAVWKNWKMDMFKRKRSEWIRQSKIKASNDGFQSFSELDANKQEDGTCKTPLQLARERHAQNKGPHRGKRESKVSSKGTVKSASSGHPAASSSK